MGWFSGIVVYILIWWLVIFGVLSHGNTPKEEGDEDGVAGAPKDVNIKKKFLITSLISAVIWVLVFLVIEYGPIDMHEWAREMGR